MDSIDTRAPGSKSLSHRAIIGAALASGESTISGMLESDDTARTLDVFKACGAIVQRLAPGSYKIQGINGAPHNNNPEQDPLICEMGESGTSCRVLTPILAAGQGSFKVQGQGRLHKRPLGELVETLRELGSLIEYMEEPNCPPLLIKACGLGSGNKAKDVLAHCGISCDRSSQYLSGMLLAAPLIQGKAQGLCIKLEGKKAVSWPYVSLTLQTLQNFGLSFTVESLDDKGFWQKTDWRNLVEAVPGKLRFIVLKGEYQKRNLEVEGDWSGASYLLSAGAIGPAPVRVQGLRSNSLQGDKAIIDILAAMGAKIKWEGNSVTVSPAPLRGITVDMGDCPDLVPTVLSVAAHATGETLITNVAHLKIKESDRMAAPAEELARLGIKVILDDSSMRLIPNYEALLKPKSEQIFSAHGDHRLAMGLSLLGLPSGPHGKRLPGFDVQIDDRKCVTKSFPNFWEEWDKIKTGSQIDI